MKTGIPGAVGDAASYNTSKLKDNIDSGHWLAVTRVKVENTEIPLFLVGDAAFSFSTRPMKCYAVPAAQQTNEQKAFNYTLVRTRRVVESAFGRLKARWRILVSNFIRDAGFAGQVSLAACVLHNICEHSAFPFDTKWLVDIEAVRRAENTTQLHAPHPQEQHPPAEQLRLILARHIKNTRRLSVWGKVFEYYENRYTYMFCYWLCCHCNNKKIFQLYWILWCICTTLQAIFLREHAHKIHMILLHMLGMLLLIFLHFPHDFNLLCSALIAPSISSLVLHPSWPGTVPSSLAWPVHVWIAALGAPHSSPSAPSKSPSRILKFVLLSSWAARSCWPAIAIQRVFQIVLVVLLMWMSWKWFITIYTSKLSGVRKGAQ